LGKTIRNWQTCSGFADGLGLGIFAIEVVVRCAV